MKYGILGSARLTYDFHEVVNTVTLVMRYRTAAHQRTLTESPGALDQKQSPLATRKVLRESAHSMKASRSALMVSAMVVGIPCGKPRYVFNTAPAIRVAVSGAESA